MKIIEPSVYTTGQIAKLCSVSIRTVARWIEANHLKAYRLPGDSTEYRVTQTELFVFLKRYGIPYEHIMDKKYLDVLMVNCSHEIQIYLNDALNSLQNTLRIDKSSSLIDSCIKLGLLKPDLFAIDLTGNEEEYIQIIKCVASLQEFENTKTIVFSELTEYSDKLKDLKTVAFYQKPIHGSILRNCILKLFD